MAEPELKTCKSCPAFSPLTGEETSGVCRAHAPLAFQHPDFFRGSTRSMLFGVYPSVGVFPLTKPGDWCLEHPGNREYWQSGVVAKPPAGAGVMIGPEGPPPVLPPNGDAPPEPRAQ